MNRWIIITALLLSLLFASTTFAQDANLKIIKKPRPAMPEDAGTLCAVGTIMLRIEFLATGKIGRVSVVKGMPVRNLTGLAVEAANKIEFEPVTKDGDPVTVFRQVEYAFGWTLGGWRSPTPKSPQPEKRP